MTREDLVRAMVVERWGNPDEIWRAERPITPAEIQRRRRILVGREHPGDDR